MDIPRSTLEFIVCTCHILDLPHETVAAALVYYYRHDQFYRCPPLTTSIDVHAQHRSRFEKKPDDTLAATAAILLASKHMETPRKVRDVVNAGYWYLQKNREDRNYGYIHVHDERLTLLKDSLVTMEKILLRTLAFDTSVDLAHPYIPLLTHALWLHLTSTMTETDCKAFSPQFKALCELSWIAVNEAYLIPSVLAATTSRRNEQGAKFDPVPIAVACVYIAMRSLELEPPLSFEQWCAAPGDPPPTIMGVRLQSAGASIISGRSAPSPSYFATSPNRHVPNDPRRVEAVRFFIDVISKVLK
ncbi:hypothetical protein BJ742DRAFT_210203 [Cladochytrium replicatum]|nr:hypothetical protein BJ742DRAFT_210203 [Cladochytrium replicatum]